MIRLVILATVAAAALACPGAALAEVVPVRYPEGFSHGFLALKNPAGATVASGDFMWIAGGEAPAFLRAEAPLSLDGPLFRTELIAPAWR